MGITRRGLLKGLLAVPAVAVLAKLPDSTPANPDYISLMGRSGGQIITSQENVSHIHLNGGHFTQGTGLIFPKGSDIYVTNRVFEEGSYIEEEGTDV